MIDACDEKVVERLEPLPDELVIQPCHIGLERLDDRRATSVGGAEEID